MNEAKDPSMTEGSIDTYCLKLEVIMGSKKELEESLRELKIDCEKVIEQLTINGCDHAWSIIKLNNMILDIDYALAPTCMTCNGSGRIDDTHDLTWDCPECKGNGKPVG